LINRKVFPDIENNGELENNENKKDETNNEEKVKDEKESTKIKKEDAFDNENKNNTKKHDEEKPPEEIFCSNCHIQITPDENSVSQTMCEECLIYWLKYYTPRPISDKKNKDNGIIENIS